MLIYHEILPISNLQDYIEALWIMQKDNSMINQRDIILPNGCSEIVFTSINGYKRQDSITNKKVEVSGAVILGQRTNYHYLEEFQDGSIDIGVRFKPNGLYPFVKNVTEITNHVLKIDEIFGRLGCALFEQIIEAPKISKKLDVIQTFFLELLPRVYKPDPLIQKAIFYVHKSKGVIQVNELARLLKISKSTLKRKFIRITGQHPKSFINVWRLNYVVGEYFNNSNTSLTQLAYKFGYFDQAHFNRDFKKFTGLNPKSYFSQKLSLTNVLSKEINSRERVYSYL